MRPWTTVTRDDREQATGAADDGACNAVDDRGGRAATSRTPPCLADDGVRADDRRMCERAVGAGVDASTTSGSSSSSEGVEVPLPGGAEEGVDDPLLLGEPSIGLRVRALHPPAGAARELACGLRAAADDRRDLVEGQREHVVQDEREPFGGSERLEHDVEGEADAVGDQSLVLGRGRAVDRHDRLGHPRADELLAARPPRTGACPGRRGSPPSSATRRGSAPRIPPSG